MEFILDLVLGIVSDRVFGKQCDKCLNSNLKKHRKLIHDLHFLTQNHFFLLEAIKEVDEYKLNQWNVSFAGNFGNFTFTMDLYKTSQYQTPYSPFDYPVKVSLDQTLWVQFEVKNAIADLVVFADSCRATTSVKPNSYPQYVFLKGG